MPLDQVLVIKATNQAKALLELILIEVVYGDASKSAYGTTISAASFALGGSFTPSADSRKEERTKGEDFLD
jgi:hypothetical protein